MAAKYFENIPRYVQLPMHQEQTIFTLHLWEICLLDSLMAEEEEEEEALASFCISLPSGQSTTISLPANSTVAALKEAAQEAFQQGWLRLATDDGQLLDPQQKWMKNRFPFSLKKQTLFFLCAMYGDSCVSAWGAYVCLAVMCIS